MENESAVVGNEAPDSKPRTVLAFPLWPLLDGGILGGRASTRDLLKILDAALPNFSTSALRIFDEWVAPFERRFIDTFRPVACSMSGGVLTVTLDGGAELQIDHPSNLTISREVFRIGHARFVRFERPFAGVRGDGTGTPSERDFVEYALSGDTVTRRDAGTAREFAYHLEMAAVEFVTG